MERNRIDTDSPPAPTPVAPPRRAGRRLGWIFLAAPLVLGTSYTIARAQDGEHGPGPGHGPGMHGDHEGGPMKFRMEKMLSAAGASDAQKAQIKSIWDGLRPQMKPLHQAHGQLHQQIAEALAAPTIDAARIEQLRQQSSQNADKLSVLMTQGMVQTANVLTPAQRQAVLKKMEEHRGPEGFPGHPGADL